MTQSNITFFEQTFTSQHATTETTNPKYTVSLKTFSYASPTLLFTYYTLFTTIATYLPVQVAARSQMKVDDCSPAEIVGSNPSGRMDVCLL